MKKNIAKDLLKKVQWWLGTVTVGIILGLSLQVATAWVNPPASPSSGNLGAPLNTEYNTQTKEGSLFLNAGNGSTYKNIGLLVANGKMGIGTTNPQYKFQLQDGGYYYSLGSAVNGAGALVAGYALDTDDNVSGSARVGIDNTKKFWIDAGYNSSTQEPLVLQNEGGKVGVGTTNPQYKFQLQDGGYYYSLGTVWGTAGSGGVAGYALDTDSTATDGSSARIGIDSDRKLWIDAGHSGSGSGPQEPLFLQSEGGKVGVGTTNPQYQFQVGNSNSVIMDSNVDGHAGMGILSNNNPVGSIFFHPNFNSFYMKAYGGRNIAFQTNSLDRMIIEDNGNVGINTNNPSQKLDVNGNVMANSFVYSSDEKLKEDIKTIDGLDIIKKLRGVNFKWKDNGEEGVGLIAQEVEKVLPELVHTDENKNLKSVEYANLVAPLIEAIKEQQGQIEKLQKELRELQNLME